jgi:hypothetical protein
MVSPVFDTLLIALVAWEFNEKRMRKQEPNVNPYLNCGWVSTFWNNRNQLPDSMLKIRSLPLSIIGFSM